MNSEAALPSPDSQQCALQDEAATEALGRAVALAWPKPLSGVIWLQGALGSGKTTLARAFLRALGVQGAVRSPTYTLVEPYQTEQGLVLHMDCYRLSEPEELEFLGLRDTPPESALWLIEWPERVAMGLPSPDLRLALSTAAPGREAVLHAHHADTLAHILNSVSQ